MYQTFSTVRNIKPSLIITHHSFNHYLSYHHCEDGNAFSKTESRHATLILPGDKDDLLEEGHSRAWQYWIHKTILSIPFFQPIICLFIDIGKPKQEL